AVQRPALPSPSHRQGTAGSRPWAVGRLAENDAKLPPTACCLLPAENCSRCKQNIAKLHNAHATYTTRSSPKTESSAMDEPSATAINPIPCSHQISTDRFGRKTSAAMSNRRIGPRYGSPAAGHGVVLSQLSVPWATW